MRKIEARKLTEAQKKTLTSTLLHHFVKYIIGETEKEIIPIYLTKKGLISITKSDIEVVIDDESKKYIYNLAVERVNDVTDTLLKRVTDNMNKIEYRKLEVTLAQKAIAGEL